MQIDTQDRHVLHWKTPGDARWAHDITVSLSPAPAGRGTQVKAVVVCKPAMSKLGYGLARAISLFSDKALLNALQAVKQQLETGEVSNNRSRPEQDDDFFTYTPALTRSQPIIRQPKPALLSKEDPTDARTHLAST
ncbi:Cyclase/dehydrase [Pseudomonas syringae pv. maculicola]|nr:Cyclase/dehydrase [Pseudomonas syringae pv. maculicola]